MLERSSKHRLIARILGLLILAGTGSVASYQSPLAQTEQQGSADKGVGKPQVEHAHPQLAGEVAAVGDKAAANAESRPNDKGQSDPAYWLDRHAGSVQSLLLLALAVLTLWYVCATRRLASIANAQNELTKIIQRAYLSIEIGNIRSLTNEDGFIPRIIIRNVGRLPAESVAWVFGEPHFATDNIWKPDKEPDVPTGAVTLAPGAEMMHGGPILLVPSEQRGQKIYLYIWGYVRYDDGFQVGRIARFSHRYNLELIQTVDRMGQRAFPKMAARYSHDYNDTK